MRALSAAFHGPSSSRSPFGFPFAHPCRPRFRPAALPTLLICALLAVWAAPCSAGLSHFSHEMPDQTDDARLKNAAENGSTDAQYLLGAMLMIRAEEQELAGWRARAVIFYKQAAGWFHQAAGAGHTRARFSLGLMHLKGRGVSRDPAKALRWLRAASRDGDPDADYLLGVMLTRGEGLRPDKRLALERFLAAGRGFRAQNRADWLAETARAVGAVAPGHPMIGELTREARRLAAAPKAESPKISMGTAWIAAPGFAVTNHHVVAGSRSISLVRPDGGYVEATVAAADAHNDLALLAVEDPCALPPALPLAESDPTLGAQVFTVGFPEPAVMGASPKLATGRVTGLSGIGGDGRAVQISVPLAHGNSGGPLVNLRGEVVGVVQSMIDASRVFQKTGVLPRDVNYAVRTEPLRRLIGRTPRKKQGVGGWFRKLFRDDCPALRAVGPGTIEDLAPDVQDSVLLVVAQ